ncbi:MAG TPA: pyridoxal phosphate-dependent aminotransferase [Methanothrix sp.]|jgi:aspartate aminotransferase|uniref:pyridoxal phosphate-dependent aminotransferase n=1 Tax=Methanothrix sp. TaxID=90426 RepID=UPI002C207215|nr:pyridoxal phosphate-dependent aminotransferase [Methanothrix sp.]MDI9417416.1 pyridoxal phosphate-dependent aminotransferase [Euryarchaeota archaeon]HON35636.1 pyridoxal phosphate-dependent aminotransferase [Methanothrix sp.]HRU74771.1 pyridoxal phosphate-dependent aminotransferase [Methanothrix sp.]
MVSARLASIQESTTLKISAMAKKLTASGLDIIDMGVGEPDFDTPKHIVEAGCNSIRMGETHYAPTAGIPELRQTIAEKLSRENRVPAGAEDVIVTPGAKMAVFAAVQALLQEGDECILIGPSWVSYEPSVAFAGGSVLWGKVDENFMPQDIAEAIGPRTRLIIVNSPTNPTGAVFDRGVLEEIRDLAVDHDLFVISDEIYEKIIYDHEHISIASLPGMVDRTVTINGFSKAYAMTGWRLGYLTGPKETMKWVIRLLSHSVSQATTFVQRAGVAALQGPQDDVEMMVAEFRARRDVLVRGLEELGIPCSKPGGAFYVFPDLSAYGGGDLFTERLLKEALIAATPGSAFGPGGADYVRLSYATSQNRIHQALERIEKIL